MTDFLLISLGLAGQWFLGVAIALAIFGPRLVRMPVRGVGIIVARAELIGLGFVLGIAGNSYLQFIWSLAGGLLGRGCSLIFACGGIAVGLVTLWIHCRAIRTTQSVDPVPRLQSGTAGAGASLARCCAMLIGLIFVSAMFQTLLTPQRLWDERAYYGLKAIVLFEDRTIFSDDLAHADFVQGHPRYPLLIPLAEQHLYALLGRVDDRLSKVLFPVLFLGMVLTMAGLLMRHLPLGQAWLGALLLATTPVLMPDEYGFLCAQADAPVGCYEGVALFYLWDALAIYGSLPSQRFRWGPSLVLAAIAGSMVTFTKDEGIAHGVVRTIAFMGTLLVTTLVSRRVGATTPLEEPNPSTGSRWKFGVCAGLALLVIPAILLTPWFAHRHQLPMTTEMNYFGRLSLAAVWNGIPTLNWSIPHLVWRMFGEAMTWGLQWWFIALTIVLFPKRVLHRPQLFLLVTLAGDVAALLLAGMIAPVMLEEHIGGSSHRYLMQLAPGAVLFALGQFRNADVKSDGLVLNSD
jgi:hypothetical protein